LDDKDYTDEELAVPLKSPTLLYYDEVTKNLRPPQKMKELGTLGMIEAKASWCALCRVVLKGSQQVPTLQTGRRLDAQSKCEIILTYTHRKNSRASTRAAEERQYGGYECRLSFD
jgi:hypothetical protein